jgi:hypothetical protein
MSTDRDMAHQSFGTSVFEPVAFVFLHLQRTGKKNGLQEVLAVVKNISYLSGKQ